MKRVTKNKQGFDITYVRAYLRKYSELEINRTFCDANDYDYDAGYEDGQTELAKAVLALLEGME